MAGRGADTGRPPSRVVVEAPAPRERLATCPPGRRHRAPRRRRGGWCRRAHRGARGARRPALGRGHASSRAATGSAASSRLEEVAGHLVDVGAESVLAVRPEAVDLVERLGAGGDLVSPGHDLGLGLVARCARRPMPRATLMGVPTDPDAARGVLTDDEVERLRAEQPWPRRCRHGTTSRSASTSAPGSAGAVVDRLVEPLLGGVYAGHASRLSLRATMPVLWERATRGESLLSPPARRHGIRGPAPTATRHRRAATRAVRRPARRGRPAARACSPPTLRRARARRCAPGPSSAAWSARHPAGGSSSGRPPTPEVVEADAVSSCVPPAPAARLLAGHAPPPRRLLGGRRDGLDRRRDAGRGAGRAGRRCPGRASSSRRSRAARSRRAPSAPNKWALDRRTVRRRRPPARLGRPGPRGGRAPARRRRPRRGRRGRGRRGAGPPADPGRRRPRAAVGRGPAAVRRRPRRRRRRRPRRRRPRARPRGRGRDLRRRRHPRRHRLGAARAPRPSRTVQPPEHRPHPVRRAPA